jgi:hypothetical protein
MSASSALFSTSFNKERTYFGYHVPQSGTNKPTHVDCLEANPTVSDGTRGVQWRGDGREDVEGEHKHVNMSFITHIVRECTLLLCC